MVCQVSSLLPAKSTQESGKTMDIFEHCLQPFPVTSFLELHTDMPELLRSTCIIFLEITVIERTIPEKTLNNNALVKVWCWKPATKLSQTNGHKVKVRY